MIYLQIFDAQRMTLAAHNYIPTLPVLISCAHVFLRRLLQPEGAFICVSFAPPEERLELLEYWDLDQPGKCLAWDVHVDAIGESNPTQGSPCCSFSRLSMAVLLRDSNQSTIVPGSIY